MNVSDETHATSDEAAEAAAGPPEKRLWSKPEIWTSDGVLWTESGPRIGTYYETGRYNLPS